MNNKGSHGRAGYPHTGTTVAPTATDGDRRCGHKSLRDPFEVLGHQEKREPESNERCWLGDTGDDRKDSHEVPSHEVVEDGVEIA